MRKFLIYSGYLVAVVLVVVAFLTTKTYTQLGVATLVYPILIYFGFELFVKRSPMQTPLIIKAQHPQAAEGKPETTLPVSEGIKTEETDSQEAVVGTVDLDRRAFLKIIGATGISIFFFSLLGRRAETLLYDRPFESRTTPIGEGESTEGLDDYLISNTDDSEIGYYGFTKPDGSWFIMKEDSDDGTFRYAKGQSDFAGNWANRKTLKYDYSHNIF